MVQKLEAINGGGGGSIKVGTKGTISSLMTRELDSIKTPKQTPVSLRHKSLATSVASSSPIPRRLQQRKLSDGVGTSSGRNGMSYKSPQSSVQKTQSFSKNVHQMPMLGSENVALERTPIRHKSDKKCPTLLKLWT
ncbi:uncharacterized protein LOC120167597 [Hibiscus syriacus]|uniref:uncharacterized protein LOC120167597 n=1 Tax=Hibiscus syriacus TaxID=106335 RepID=UPI0019222B9C|nr:uncharacterized protein LOC120167597 [Hibiscus syriacus]